MNHKEKIKWMIKWAHENKVVLDLEGECGFGRECVGIVLNGSFPEYEWYDDEYNEISGNDVWTPKDAYHKSPCVAVLGRGEFAEKQLYDWLKWFDDNNYKVSSVPNTEEANNVLAFMLRPSIVRMVKI
jgi:hypothetical protein